MPDADLPPVPAEWDAVARKAQAVVRPVVARVSPGHADDALQEALIKAEQHFREFAPLSRMLAWIRTTAIREALRYGKYGYGRYERPAGDRDDLAALLPEGALAVAGHEDSAAVRVDFTAILDRLRPADQDVLLLAYAGLDGAQLADALGTTENAARTRLMRARKRYHAAAARAARGSGCGATVPLWERLRRLITGAEQPAAAVTARTAAAFAVAVVTAVPVPSALRPQGNVPPRAVAGDTAAAHSTDGTPRPARGGADGARPTPPATAPSPAPGAPRGGSAPPRVEGRGVCALLVCVEESPSPSPGAIPPPRRGDGITPAGSGHTIRQRVTPACWAVPPQDRVACESGEPGSYAVEPSPVPPPGQEPPRAGAKSAPSAPRSGEPSKEGAP